MKFSEAISMVISLIFKHFLLTLTLSVGIFYVILGIILTDPISIGIGLIITTLGFIELLRVIRNLPIGYGTIRGTLIEFFKNSDVRMVFGRLIDSQFNETGFFFFESIPDKVFVKSSMFAVTFEIGEMIG